MNFVSLNIEYFPDPTRGVPVYKGYIYVGDPDTDPEIPGNQKEVKFRLSDGTLITAAQPIETGAGGVPLYNGSAVQLLVEGDYAITVLNERLAQVYYVGSASGLYPVGDPILGGAFLLTDLKGFTPLFNGVVTKLTGRDTNSDGGEGSFCWDSSDKSSYVTNDPLSGLYVAPNSDPTGASGAWVRQYDKMSIYVAWFGAKGDNATDDTVAIQAAVASATDVGGTVRFPSGEYIVTATITLPDANIRLAGPQAPENQDQGNNGTADIKMTAADTDLFACPGAIQVTNVWFEKLRLFGNNDLGDGVFINGTTFSLYNGGTIDCAFIDFRVGYNCVKGFFNTHIRPHFWNNSIAGHYGWGSVSNVYDTPNVGLVPSGAIGIWSHGANDLVLNSSTSAESSGAGSIMWRVGNDSTDTDPNTGAPMSTNISTILFDSCHFEGAKGGFISVALGSRASGIDCHFITSSVLLPYGVRYTSLDDVCSWDRCIFTVKSGGSYTTNIEVAARVKGKGGLLIIPVQWDTEVVVTGLTVTDGLSYIVPTIAARANASATQSVPSAVATEVVLGAETYDTMNCFSSNRFTAKVPGLYDIKGQIRLSGLSAAKYIECRLFVNSTQVGTYRGWSGGGATTFAAAADVRKLDLGDEVTMKVYHNEGVNLDITSSSTATFLAVCKLP